MKEKYELLERKWVTYVCFMLTFCSKYKVLQLKGIPAGEDEPPRLVKSWDLRALTAKEPKQKVRTNIVIDLSRSPIPTPNLTPFKYKPQLDDQRILEAHDPCACQEQLRKTGSETMLPETSQTFLQRLYPLQQLRNPFCQRTNLHLLRFPYHRLHASQRKYTRKG